MERVKLEVRSREERGKDVRALRAAGDIPGVIYQAGVESTSITINARDLRTAVTGPGGLYALLDVTVDGNTARPAVIKDMQLDPVRDTVMHVDLHEIRLDRKLQTVVAVHLEGVPHGVGMGGVLSQPQHEVQISVLPTAIPEVIMVDVSELDIGQSLRLIDVPAPEGVEFLDDLEGTVIAIVSAPISEAELEGEPAEGEEGEEGEEGVEGEEGEATGDDGEASEEAPAESE
jgi:large subunit ribosomal protein L25